MVHFVVNTNMMFIQNRAAFILSLLHVGSCEVDEFTCVACYPSLRGRPEHSNITRRNYSTFVPTFVSALNITMWSIERFWCPDMTATAPLLTAKTLVWHDSHYWQPRLWCTPWSNKKCGSDPCLTTAFDSTLPSRKPWRAGASRGDGTMCLDIISLRCLQALGCEQYISRQNQKFHTFFSTWLTWQPLLTAKTLVYLTWQPLLTAKVYPMVK